MEVIVKKWLDYAKADLEAAEVLSQHPKSHWSYQLAVLHCHQAVEKILKTIIVARDEEPKKIHDLVRLGELSKLEFSLEDQDYIKELNIHYQPSRYPDIFYKESTPRYSKENMEHHLEKTKKLFLWIKTKIKSKD
ncbi:HEPN domain-containing protein [Patescibacteria group bacterium]|nr:HEPN domain-containing protein [Patescibacteria group bacterium]MBU4141559.1 HEPN domain-containing protein [Patescibacteria group bacterium]MBU4338555.1 HEPN domain-containing protein [Patescibacteria group bacterium]MBU4580724.1 HEPN domain-containing protein [Patescibacteria group bacterium]